VSKTYSCCESRASKDAELVRLRSLAARAEDVKKLAFIIQDAAIVGALSWPGAARAVVAYLKGEGK